MPLAQRLGGGADPPLEVRCGILDPERDKGLFTGGGGPDCRSALTTQHRFRDGGVYANVGGNVVQEGRWRGVDVVDTAATEGSQVGRDTGEPEGVKSMSRSSVSNVSGVPSVTWGSRGRPRDTGVSWHLREAEGGPFLVESDEEVGEVVHAEGRSKYQVSIPLCEIPEECEGCERRTSRAETAMFWGRTGRPKLAPRTGVGVGVNCNTLGKGFCRCRPRPKSQCGNPAP